MKRPEYILLRLLLVAIPLLFALAPARAQNVVYAGQTSELSVVEVPGDSYEWELYNDVTGLNLAVVPGNCPAGEAFFIGGITTGPTVNVIWLVPGTYFYKVTATNTCPTNNLKIGKMTVLPSLPTATLAFNPDVICMNDSTTLVINLTGTGPWSIDLFDGLTTTTYNNIMASPFNLIITPLSTTTYVLTSVSDANTTNNTISNEATVTVNSKPGSSRIYQYEPISKKK
ncbi:MAG: hypothetical protein CVU14_10560 [Bacteroidetes bacterium HGW-Bacteroidetes-9]|nr:MAG: hypothetical protein CVU14_10560 [Bacteroidetes bacterium HGW-Bacteroidetes-9]